MKEGFFINSLNPKVKLFFLSIFSQVVELGVSCFVILSFILINKKVAKVFKKFHFYLMEIMGMALAFLGLKIIFEKRIKFY